MGFSYFYSDGTLEEIKSVETVVPFTGVLPPAQETTVTLKPMDNVVPLPERPDDCAISVTPITGALGAEVRGVDFGRALDADTVAAVKAALLEHLVLYFPDQDLEPDHLVAMAGYFGELEKERFIPPLEGHPGVHILKGISKSKLTTQNLMWHVDHSYKPQPSFGGALYAVDVPESGGDTMFASMYAAYDALSDRMKQYLESLVAVHDVVAYGLRSGLFETEDTRKAILRMPPAAEHPLVCTHPETGRKMLFVNQAWTTKIKDLDPHESQSILTFLFEHATKVEFQCRIRWRNRGLLLWDNRAVQHRGIPDYEGPRIMHRVAIKGEWTPQ